MKLLTRFTLLASLATGSCVSHDVNPSFECTQSTLTLALSNVTPASACGVSDATVRVMASGGEEPYTYSLDSHRQAVGEFMNLSSDVYTVMVTDAKGCSAELNNISVMAEGLSFTTFVTENTDCAGGNGRVEISVEEGEAPFLYKLGQADFGSNSIFETLRHGEYSIVLKDAAGCTSTLNITVPKGQTGTSWAGEIRPLMTKHCATSGCHNGKSRPDLRLYEKAKFYASQIRQYTQDGTMPFDGSLTQAEIDLIACWIDEGALDN